MSSEYKLFKLKKTLKVHWGTLRMASLQMKIPYTKLSGILNGWIKPNQEEQEKLDAAVEAEKYSGKVIQ